MIEVMNHFTRQGLLNFFERKHLKTDCYKSDGSASNLGSGVFGGSSFRNEVVTATKYHSACILFNGVSLGRFMNVHVSANLNYKAASWRGIFTAETEAAGRAHFKYVNFEGYLRQKRSELGWDIKQPIGDRVQDYEGYEELWPWEISPGKEKHQEINITSTSTSISNSNR